MQLEITANSLAYDSEYGGTQTIAAEEGEYPLDAIFRLHFFRVIVDLVVGGSVCFRLMEGSEPHYFVLEGAGDSAEFERETGIGYDRFTFRLKDGAD